MILNKPATTLQQRVINAFIESAQHHKTVRPWYDNAVQVINQDLQECRLDLYEDLSVACKMRQRLNFELAKKCS